ncbi:MAG: hypothetical protein C4527_16515 [Candidatus Omnitrophota bacterium]|jgi:hypothetical protein|nr:MAG: hypothetical protein C4527_16515 [Candidatus Omnitrophota bacterium]
MDQHVRIVGVLHIIAGAFGILIGIIVLFVMGGVAFIVGVSAETGGSEIAIPILMAIGVIFAGFAMITSIPGILAGLGLLKRQSWARFLAIFISILYIPLHVPLGTALGVYSLWVLFSKETELLFNQKNS